MPYKPPSDTSDNIPGVHDVPRSMRVPDRVRVRYVLAGLAFPAHVWQLVAQADHYGADAQLRAEIVALPSRRYVTLLEVESELERAHITRTSMLRLRPR